MKGGVSAAVEANAHALLVKEREATCALLEEWMAQQKVMFLEQASKQELFFQRMLEAHYTTLQSLKSNSSLSMQSEDFQSPSARMNRAAMSPLRSSRGDTQPTPCTPRDEAGQEVEPPRLNIEIDAEHRASSQKLLFKLEDELEALDKHDGILNWWKRTSGLQTVEKWVSNYKKHPAGWAALLMIQGIPEVTGRLRSKVENYAIYSALFLSMSIALLTDVPSFVYAECPEQDLSNVDWWLCHIRLRLYLYGFAIGTAAHMLSILLAMSFVNALNETARDCDVYRMFSRGKGFIATVKCQYAFRLGCVADFVAVMVAVSYHIGWEAVVGTLILFVFILWKRKQTSDLLFDSCSIVKYWREEMGGKPDKDDPYDLQVPVGIFQEGSKTGRKLFSCSENPSADSALWARIYNSVMPDTHIPNHAAHHGQSSGLSHVQSAAVAALF